MATVLLVEDDRNARRLMTMALESRGHAVTACEGPAAASEALAAGRFDVVLTDLRMDGRDAGLDVVRESRQRQPAARVLLVTAYASADTAVEALKEGAFDYLTKPVSGEELALAVEQALADATGAEAASEGPDEDEGMLIGRSPAIRRVRERLARAADKDFTILISGESGTGKEVAARFVHSRSRRRAGPFVPVHCGAIPGELFEAELFGAARGAFTGAVADRAGLVESADGGTLFLDEVGEMPLSIQVKLLRVLQDHQVRRVGESAERRVDVRVIAATNRDLAEEVRQGRFREDLFYRLNVVPVHMPPLRQRREDIPMLADALIARHAPRGMRPRLSEAALARLMRLPLPGNVRELENLLQRMMALAEGEVLGPELLDGLGGPGGEGEALSLARLREQDLNLDEALEEMERRLVREALDASGGNVTRAAELLGVSFRSLRYRLKKLGVKAT